MNDLPGLNFQLGEDIDALRDAVRDFAQAEIAPRATEIDNSDQFPMDLWQKMGGLGVLGITVPEADGGAGMGYLAHMVAMEEISRASASVGLSYGAHSSLETLRDGGWLAASAQTKNPSAVEVVRLMRQQFDSLVSTPPTADELKARKATMIGGFTRSLDTTSGLAAQISERVVNGVPLDEINYHIERIEAIDADQVRDFARRHLAAKGLHVVVVGDGTVFGEAMHKAWPDARIIKSDKLDLSRADFGAED